MYAVFKKYWDKKAVMEGKEDDQWKAVQEREGRAVAALGLDRERGVLIPVHRPVTFGSVVITALNF